MNSSTPDEILDSALMLAYTRGIPVSGWHIERSDEGFSAWLFVNVHAPDRPTYSRPLFSRGEVSICETLEEAALACLALAGTLGAEPSEGIGEET